MKQGGNTIGGMLHQPFLYSSHTVAQHVGFQRFLHAELREVANTIRNEFTTLIGVQASLLIEEIVHIHAPQLGDTLFLGHALIELVNLLFHIFIVRLLAGS